MHLACSLMGASSSLHLHPTVLVAPPSLSCQLLTLPQPHPLSLRPERHHYTLHFTLQTTPLAPPLLHPSGPPSQVRYLSFVATSCYYFCSNSTKCFFLSVKVG